MHSNEFQRKVETAKLTVSAVLIMAAGAGGLLLRGMYFAGEMYIFLTVWFVLCAVWSGIRLLLTRMDRIGDSKFPRDENKGMYKWAIACLLTCPLVIWALYSLHGLHDPLSAQGTLEEMLRWGLYAGFAAAACFCAGNVPGSRLLAAVWHLLGMVISLSALLAICGGLNLPYAVAYSPSPEVSATGARLGGLLQYPNTFGAVMAVFLLERLFAAAVSQPGKGTVPESMNVRRGRKGGAEDRRGAAGAVSEGQGAAHAARQLLRMLPLFPYAAALLLSESRGAMLTAACASAAVLLWKRRLAAPLLVAGAAPVAAAALLYRQLAPAALAVEPLPGPLLLAGLWAGALLAGLWLCRRSCCAAGRVRAAALVLAAVCWTAAGTAVLGLVRERITGPSSTVAARGLFFRDAWKLAGEAPWLGRGGGTWRNSYLAAQSRPYVGNQVHSGYLDILLNTGMVGLACCLLLLLSAGWLTGRYAPRLLPPVLVIALHGAVDFDWSYSLVWLLLLLLPALALADARQQAEPPAVAVHKPAPGTSRSPRSGSAGMMALSPTANSASAGMTALSPGSTANSHVNGIPSRPSSIRISAPYTGSLHSVHFSFAARLCLCVICIILALVSFTMLMGERLYRQAEFVLEPALRSKWLRQSLEWNPRQPGTAVGLSRLLPDAEAETVLLSSLKYSPENAALHWELAVRYMKEGDPGQALHWVRRSLQLDVFNASKHLDSARGMLEMSRRKSLEGERDKAIASAAAGLELLRGYRLLAVQEERKGEQHNDRLFRITAEAEELDFQLRLEIQLVYAIQR